jgi:hypothetical protein
MASEFLVNSDKMLCTNSAYLHYKDQAYNDAIFMLQMRHGGCVSPCELIERENGLKITQSSRLADNVSCTPRESTGFKCTNEFLLTPCPKNTYQNYMVYDDKKMCSKSHQILNNMTRRK